MSSDWIELVEAAYWLDGTMQQWLERVAHRAAKLVPERQGALAYLFDAKPSRASSTVAIGAVASSGVPADFVDCTRRLNEQTESSQVDYFYGQGITCGTVSEAHDEESSSLVESEEYERCCARRGFPDSFGLTASAPDRRGVVVNAPLSRRQTLHPTSRKRWSQLGVHLHAAYRLRRQLELSDEPAEAILTPEASVVHAEGAARPQQARGRLRRAVVDLETARSRRTREDPDKALELWQGLVAGRWSLVDRFDRDGRRFLVARPNPPDVTDPRALSDRERVIVGLVAQGDSNKWIAYELGISPGAVATMLARAMRKLGIGTRAELIWLVQQLGPRP